MVRFPPREATRRYGPFPEIVVFSSCYNPYTLGGAIDLAWGDTS